MADNLLGLLIAGIWLSAGALCVGMIGYLVKELRK